MSEARRFIHGQTPWQTAAEIEAENEAHVASIEAENEHGAATEPWW